jgi:hypothetical protein
MTMKKAIAILPLVLTLTLASPVEAAKPSKAPAPAARHSVGMGCVSPPPGWQVSLLQHEDWVSGQVRETASGRFVSFAIGMGGAPAASPARIAKFQWLKTEKLGDADLHYGLEKKADGHFILEATVVRGALVANFITPQRDLQSLPSLLSIARSYSEKCPEATRNKK